MIRCASLGKCFSDKRYVQVWSSGHCLRGDIKQSELGWACHGE